MASSGGWPSHPDSPGLPRDLVLTQQTLAEARQRIEAELRIVQFTKPVDSIYEKALTAFIKSLNKDYAKKFKGSSTAEISLLDLEFSFKSVLQEKEEKDKDKNLLTSHKLRTERFLAALYSRPMIQSGQPPTAATVMRAASVNSSSSLTNYNNPNTTLPRTLPPAVQPTHTRTLSLFGTLRDSGANSGSSSSGSLTLRPSHSVYPRINDVFTDSEQAYGNAGLTGVNSFQNQANASGSSVPFIPPSPAQLGMRSGRPISTLPPAVPPKLGSQDGLAPQMIEPPNPSYPDLLGIAVTFSKAPNYADIQRSLSNINLEASPAQALASANALNFKYTFALEQEVAGGR